MKNIIKRIFIGVSIGLIIGFINSCEVNAQSIDIAPNKCYQGFLIGTNQSVQLESTPSPTIVGGVGYYTCSFQTGSGYSPIKSVFQYDLSNTTEEYITFYIYMRGGYSPSVILNENRCDRISYSGAGSASFTGFTAYSCKNTKSSVSYLNMFYGTTDILSTNSNFNFFVVDSVYLYNDATEENINVIKNSVNETNEFLKDTSLPNNSSGDIADLNSNIAENGTISSLVTMPITFLQKIVAGLNGTCSPITIGELYNYNMTMPCINPQQYIGIIWNIIDVICAGFLSFHFSKRLVSIFHKITSMKDGGLEEAYD